MNKLQLAIVVIAVACLTPVTIIWGIDGFGSVWLGFGFVNALLLGAFSWNPLTGALVVASGPIGLADSFRRR